MKKVAIVTGGAKGIGASIVHQLVADGFQVAIGDYNLANAQQFAAQFANNQVKAFQADVSQKEDVDSLVSQTVNEFGQLDVMINNAGISKEYPLLKMTEEEFDQLIAVNIKGVLFGIQAAATQYIKQGTPGKIINASSVGGYKVSPNHGGYSATKFAVRSLTQAAAREFGKYGITTNCYCPGYTMTPMMKQIVKNYSQQLHISPDELAKQKSAEVALRRPAQPEDIANVVSFLTSDKANYVNGQAIVVDGGLIYK
ncbi:glucose 1-dehydrogenase [Limosilactobacillus kribbianus]|uniref:glucose 1-dehydrogenase n=1 Tax=Limosilactobacillus kribbianus TaxID=2982695 RepID=UPI002263F9FF|nr:glucose 1-dehydrogenase [Limosilactobacillus kribbianus]